MHSGLIKMRPGLTRMHLELTKVQPKPIKMHSRLIRMQQKLTEMQPKPIKMHLSPFDTGYLTKTTQHPQQTD